MSKEMPETSDVKNDTTVSTSTEFSENACTTSSVQLESNLSNNTIEDDNNSSKILISETSNTELLDIEKGNLDSSDKKMGNGDPVISNDKGAEETTKSKEKVEDVEEEDVPGDFFDDFLKEDFMDGLDIVDDDAWDEDKMKKDETSTEKPKDPAKDTSSNKIERSKKRKQKSSSKIDHVERFIASPPGEKRHKQKKKKHEERSTEQKVKKGKEKIIDADEFDIRRDPEKTKRDIERDKARCEKDKEKKIISEKLNLVETGLVPPGMEMEIDIEEVKRQKEKIEQNKPPRDLRDHLKTLRSRSKSVTRKQRSPKKTSASRKSKSPSRRSSPKRKRTRSPIRRRSPARVSPVRRSSPSKRSPVNTSVLRRSPYRRNSPRRSPLRRSQERSYGEKRSLRRSRSHSPYYRNRRVRYSPRHRVRSNSRESDREIWLKRRRSRSRSPRRKREEKKSFLQEIAEKLNETRPQPVNVMPQLQQSMHFPHPQSMQTAPVPVPAPAPVPPPNSNTYFTPQPRPQPQLQPQQQYDPYDQNFFIGTPQPVGPPNFVGQPQPASIGLQPQTVSARPVISPHIGSTSIGCNPSRNLENYMLHTPGGMKDSKEAMGKLFQDKKITLSEFLAVTAKPEVASSSSPAHLQEKIKVISRCQEAINILGVNEKKYTGKLVVHRSDNFKVSEEKNRSPLMRTPPVIFPFTQHQIKRDQKTSFTSFINQLLQKIGVMKEVIVDVDTEMPSDAGISPTARKISPPPPPLITNRNSFLNDTKPKSTPYNNMLYNNRLSKMVQTDILKCESCEKRRKILYKTSGVQCGGDLTTFSVSTQVTDSDFYSKIPITQSLASLTPAQLLAKSRSALESSMSSAKFGRGVDKDDYDIMATKSSFTGRTNFPRLNENYNLPRYSPPSPTSHYNLPAREESMPSSMYNATPLRNPFIGGGGGGVRGRAPQSNPTRPLAPNNRFGYNNYF